MRYGLQRVTASGPATAAHALLLLVVFSSLAAAEPAGGATNRAWPSNGDAPVPEVPGDDIFGFTTPTDVGKAGDTAFGNENDARLGKRSGTYNVLNPKYEFSRTVTDNWWVAGSFFLDRHHVRGVPALQDVNGAAFDGLSFEIEGRILKRSAGSPFAVSASMEPRWSRTDAVTGLPADAFNVGLKLFADAVIVPDRLFWAANLIWTPQIAQRPEERSRWLSTSTTLVSFAMTYQAAPWLFIGGEARYLASFDSALPERNVGNAVFVGPTLLWKISSKVTLNTTYQPQVFGHSNLNPALRLDLDNFERAQFRAKLGIALQ
jgi:hypothetical protein